MYCPGYVQLLPRLAVTVSVIVVITEFPRRGSPLITSILVPINCPSWSEICLLAADWLEPGRMIMHTTQECWQGKKKRYCEVPESLRTDNQTPKESKFYGDQLSRISVPCLVLALSGTQTDRLLFLFHFLYPCIMY